LIVAFARNVFLNCPFDEEYRILLRPMIFTIVYLGYTPRIALETLDSGTPRIDKIVRLIRESKFAIHDLSRCQAKRPGEYFRLNMPLELGIDVGCRRFGSGQHKLKRCLILEAKSFRYQAAISDLAGSDIVVHKDRPTDLVRGVRNWLHTQVKRALPSPTKVYDAYTEFMEYNYEDLKRRGFSMRDRDRLPIPELIECMQEWVRNTKPG
jgi:hypothetical protein